MPCWLRSQAILRAINGSTSLSSRLQPASSTLSAIMRSDRMASGLEDTTSRSTSIADTGTANTGKEKFSAVESDDSGSVHPTAIVHQEAIICEDVVIGPFCTVGSAVKLGKGCMLHSNSHVLGKSELGEGCILHTGAVVGSDIAGCTILGKENSIGHYAVIGVQCQDLKYKGGEDCHLHIGDKNDIREYVSIHRSSKSSDQTTVGNGNLIMGSCHIAHDCKLGNDNILANGTLLGGHVILQVVRDVPMYMMVSGDRAELCGLNLEGLRRHKFCDNEIRLIKKAYQKLFMNSDGKLEDRLAIVESIEEMMSMPAVVQMLSSVRKCFGENRRGICNFGRWRNA